MSKNIFVIICFLSLNNLKAAQAGRTINRAPIITADPITSGLKARYQWLIRESHVAVGQSGADPRGPLLKKMGKMKISRFEKELKDLEFSNDEISKLLSIRRKEKNRGYKKTSRHRQREEQFNAEREGLEEEAVSALLDLVVYRGE